LRQSIAATLIAGESVKTGRGQEDFYRCLRSLDPVVDKIFVTYNGDDDLPTVPEGIKVIWNRDGWNDDFALARNASFDMVHRYSKLNQKEFDWILWIDTDDTLEGNIHYVLDNLDSKSQVVMLRYDYAVDPKTEQVLAVQWRERLFRTDMPTKWAYPIHEVCRFPVGTQIARKDGAWIRHWREPKNERTDTRARNRKILAKARAEHPDEPRFKYYFANEVYAEAALAQHEQGRPDLELINAAIKAYEDFIPDSPSPDDAYLASHQVAELQRMAHNHMGAIEADLRSLMIHPTWPDAYVGIAQSYMALEDWDKVEFWAGAVLKVCAEQDTTQVREPLNDVYLPKLLLGIAAEMKGRLHDAMDIYRELDEQNLASEVKDRIASVKKKILDGYANQNLIPTLENNKPSDRNRLFGTQPEKSIAFFTAPLFESWHPELMKTGGIGGAETCVMEVAARFAADGWRTVVFGTPGDHRGVHEPTGVEYWNADEFSATEPFTVFVSSRIPQIFDANVNARTKMLWMHDVNAGENPFEGEFGDRMTQIDYVIGLTDWHCQHLHRLYNIPLQKLIKIPNGVDLDRFGEIDESKRQKHKFVFSSSPDRGIDVVLNVWPKLKTRFPDAELHVFYGWNSIDKIVDIQPTNPLGRFKEGVMGIIEEMGGEDYGIFWHNRVTQTELAEHLKTCHAWLYPTYFMETFCITAIEMQAAGVIPITSNVAALQETVGNPALRVDGWPNNVSFLRQYTDTVIRTVSTTKKHQEGLRERGYHQANKFTWDAAFRDWQTAVYELALV
jgi:glycosyltransferase involved in cell wall biosynthesis/tetratricopeptide (TPR) repeat protein